MPGNPVKWTAAFASPISNPNSTSSPGTLSWMAGAVPTSGSSGTVAPALTNLQNKNVWMINNDNDGRANLWPTKYDMGAGWSGQPSISGGTSEAPSFTAWGGWLYCVYTATDSNLYYVISKDGGETWSGTQQIPHNRVKSGPSIAVWNGGSGGDELYYAYRGLGEDGIWIIRSNDGNGYSWDTAYQITIPGYTITTSAGPALCVFQGKLWCTFRGMDTWFYTITSSDGRSWSDPVGNGLAMDSAPTLCVVPGQQGNPDALLSVFGVSTGDNTFYYTYNTSGDPGNWHWGGLISNLSRVNGTGMGLTVWNDIIFGAYLST